MAERKRIQWSEHEQDEVYSSFLSLKDKEKLKLPPSHWTEMSKVMKVLGYAQQSLPAGRRRHLSGIVAIPPYLLKRMQDSGYLPRNMAPLQKGYKPEEEETDPRDEKIKELEAALEHLKGMYNELEGQVRDYQNEILRLQNQPSPVQLIQSWVAETLALALTKAEDSKKPAGQRVPPEVGQTKKPEPLPQFERERRKDPVAFVQAVSEAAGTNKPKFAIVADFVGSDKARIHEEASSVAELRYLDHPNKLSGLKIFNANGGRIILWADHASHNMDEQLGRMGVSFHRHRGSLPSLIQHVKDTVEKLKGLK